MAELREMGVTHIVTSKRGYGRFFSERFTPNSEDSSKNFDTRRRFYTDLFEHGELLWDSRDSEAPKKGFCGGQMVVYRMPDVMPVAQSDGDTHSSVDADE